MRRLYLTVYGLVEKSIKWVCIKRMPSLKLQKRYLSNSQTIDSIFEETRVTMFSSVSLTAFRKNRLIRFGAPLTKIGSHTLSNLMIIKEDNINTEHARRLIQTNKAKLLHVMQTLKTST